MLSSLGHTKPFLSWKPLPLGLVQSYVQFICLNPTQNLLKLTSFFKRLLPNSWRYAQTQSIVPFISGLYGLPFSYSLTWLELIHDCDANNVLRKAHMFPTIGFQKWRPQGKYVQHGAG